MKAYQREQIIHQIGHDRIAEQKAFFDVRVFNPLAKRYSKQNVGKCYEINEKIRRNIIREGYKM